MIKKFMSRLSLTMIFTGLFFVIILVNLGIVAVSGYFFVRDGEQQGSIFQHPAAALIMIFAVSIFTGVAMTAICTAIMLRPVHDMLGAMKQLAGGDFKVRYQLTGDMKPYELIEFSEEFNRMAQELGSIEMLRSDFVNNFSHEFKTPIVSLKGFAKLLKEGNLTPEEQEEYLDIIINESDRLAVLATNVLNLSKIENQTIVSENSNFNLSEQIRRTILMMDSKWDQKELDLEVDLEEINYFGNSELLNQVWVNVLDNAVKFSEYGQKVQIKLLDFYDCIIFKVRDYGCGMDKETMEHIFDKFYQGDTSHAVQGNGLGLTMVNKIIDLHKGKISVESTPGEGTLITIALPKKEEEKLKEKEKEKVIDSLLDKVKEKLKEKGK